MWWFVREFKEEGKKNSKKEKKRIPKKISVKKKKIKKVLIKFWEVNCKEGVLLWRRRGKKNVEWKFQKELTFQLILKTLLIFTFIHFYFIPFTFTLHYVLIKFLFDLKDCVVQILIWLNKKCGINSFWHPFMRLLVLSWLSIFHVIYMWGIWFFLHYSAQIYIVESVTSHFRVISFVEW